MRKLIKRIIYMQWRSLWGKKHLPNVYRQTLGWKMSHWTPIEHTLQFKINTFVPQGHITLIRTDIKTFIILKRFWFQINAVLLNFLCIKEITFTTKIWSSTTLIIMNVSWTSNQHIVMISEGSCDTEDWSNDPGNSALITEINYI